MYVYLSFFRLSLLSLSSLRFLIKSSRSFAPSLFSLSISKFLGGSIRGCLRESLLALSSQRELESEAKVEASAAAAVVYRRKGEENANRGKSASAIARVLPLCILYFSVVVVAVRAGEIYMTSLELPPLGWPLSLLNLLTCLQIACFSPSLSTP